MSDIRYNGWLHRSGTGGVWQDSSGRVGVGTSTPNMSLHVLSSSDDVVRLQSTSASNGPALTLDHIGASPADGDIIGKVVFNGEDDGANSTTYADIRVISTDVSNGSEDGDITFGTRAAGTYAERIRITSAGRLGIGDASPTKALTVGTATPVVLLDDQSSRTLEIRGPSTTHNATVLTTSNHDLLLGTNNTERLRIQTNGRVGVGTASARAFLDLYGAAENATLLLDSNDANSNICLNDNSGSARLLNYGGELAIRTGGNGPFVGDNEALRIDSNRRLLLGHTADIGLGFRYQIVGTDGNTSSSCQVRFTNSASGPSFVMAKSRNATAGSNTILQDGDTLGQIQFRGDDGTDYNTIGASIRAQVDGTPGANDMPGRLTFQTN